MVWHAFGMNDEAEAGERECSDIGERESAPFIPSHSSYYLAEFPPKNGNPEKKVIQTVTKLRSVLHDTALQNHATSLKLLLDKNAS